MEIVRIRRKIKTQLNRKKYQNQNQSLETTLQNSKKHLKRSRVGPRSTRVLMKYLIVNCQSLTTSQTLMALILLVLFVIKELVDPAILFLSLKSLNLDLR
jgi:hypothetical protein